MEFEDTAVDKVTGLFHTFGAYVRITKNGEQICLPSSGPAKSFWDDEPPIQLSVSATEATEDAPVTTSQAIAQLRSAGIVLREETPGAESSTRKGNFPGPRKDASRGRRVRRCHVTMDPYMVKEEEEGSPEDSLEPLRRELSELKLTMKGY